MTHIMKVWKKVINKSLIEEKNVSKKLVPMCAKVNKENNIFCAIANRETKIEGK